MIPHVKLRLLLLRNKNDKDLAKRLKTTPYHAKAIRATAKFRKHQREKQPTPEWLTPEREQLLGQETDRELAKRWGVSKGKVTYHRRERFISATHTKRPPVRWTAEMLVDLPHLRDCEMRDKYGMSITAVGRKRKDLGLPKHPDSRKSTMDWTEADKLLGRVTDREIAEMMKCHKSTVAYRRRKMGIASFRTQNKARTKTKTKISKRSR